MLNETQYNPDVLSCLANLSSDEVFTPPSVANQVLDLLPPELWSDPQATFLDPACKSGVFLREITRRLDEGLEAHIPDRQARIDHILTKQVFGLPITELTALLARRSVYCSKTANGKFSVCTQFADEQGNLPFTRVEHTWKDGKCIFCGASQGSLDRDEQLETHAYAFIHSEDIRSEISKWFGDDMQFDVIVGNPPYQLDDGGYGTSAAPIYNRFVEQAKKLNPRLLTMIIPARWFAGGKRLDDFREAMLADARIRSIDDYLSADDIFPGVGLKGGICYFLWDRDNPGPCRFSTHFKDWPVSTATRPLRESGADVLIRFNEGLSILKKVVAIENGRADSLSLEESRRFDTLVSSLRPFGLRTFFQGRTSMLADDVKVYQNGGIGYIAKRDVTTGTDLIDNWKVYVGRAAPGTGNRDTYPHRIISTPFVGEPGSISTETYLCIGPLDSESEAESVLSYLHCRLTRFLILLHKPSQDTTRKVYTFVPAQDWSRQWTDEDLYAKYDLSADEIAFIESIVRPMETGRDRETDLEVLGGELDDLED